MNSSLVQSVSRAARRGCEAIGQPLTETEFDIIGDVERSTAIIVETLEEADDLLPQTWTRDQRCRVLRACALGAVADLNERPETTENSVSPGSWFRQLLVFLGIRS